jgi:hypothetical protein
MATSQTIAGEEIEASRREEAEADRDKHDIAHVPISKPTMRGNDGSRSMGKPPLRLIRLLRHTLIGSPDQIKIRDESFHIHIKAA